VPTSFPGGFFYNKKIIKKSPGKEVA